MAMFKDKSKRTFTTDNRITLDAKHNDMLKYFKDRKKSLPEKKKELKYLQEKSDELKNIPNKDLTNEQLNEKFKINDNINNIKKYIENIELNTEENNYFLKTGHILYKYYDNIDSVAKSSFNSNDDYTDDDDDFDEFDDNDIKGNIKNDIKNDIKEEKKNNEIKNMSDFIITSNKFNRANILDDYLKIIDPSYIGIIKNDLKYDKCNVCNCEKLLIQSDGIMVCERCGDTTFVVIDSDKPSYKDPQVMGDEKQQAVAIWICCR